MVIESNQSSRRRRPKHIAQSRRDYAPKNFIQKHSPELLDANKKAKQPWVHWWCHGSFVLLTSTKVFGAIRSRALLLLPKRRMKMVIILLILCFLVAVHGYFPLSIWGDGFNPDGGLAGNFFNPIILSLQSFPKKAPIRRGLHKFTYPDVPSRNTREKVSSYSRFLEVILNWHFRRRNNNLTLSKQNTRASTGKERTADWVSELHLEDSLSIFDVLHGNNCRPGWICYRCLFFYSNDNQRCKPLCPTCYFKLLCSKVHGSRYLTNKASRHTNHAGQHGSGSGDQNTFVADDIRQIPRIIHQTGPLDWLNPRMFPNLVRLQNSWRQAPNATYRYYTPEMATRFVQKHFAPLERTFVSLPESEKSVLFTFMVLYEMGGVAASVELLLEVNLDSAVWNTNVSFVGAVMSDFEDVPGCLFLWSGFVAASPKHPVIALAIQLFLESRRSEWSDVALSTVWDAAATVCSSSTTSSNVRRGDCWRSSAVWHDFQSYILGKAYWDIVLGESGHLSHDDLTIFGFNPSPSFELRSLLLLMSSDDTGSTRITNVETNLLVASTKLRGLSLTAIDQFSQQLLRGNSG